MKIYTWKKYATKNNIKIENKFWSICAICRKNEIDYVAEIKFNKTNTNTGIFFYCHDCFDEIYNFMNNYYCEKCKERRKQK